MRPDIRTSGAGSLVVADHRADLVILKARREEIRRAVASRVDEQNGLARILTADRVCACRVRQRKVLRRMRSGFDREIDPSRYAERKADMYV